MIEMIQHPLFWLVAVIAVLSASGVVLSRNAIYSALSLLANFIMLAALYLMLNAQFIAIVQVVVYADAVVVLFVFVEMLLGAVGRIPVVERLTPHLIVALVVGFLIMVIVGSVVYEVPIGGARGSATQQAINQAGQVQVLGMTLFTDYLLAVELAGVLMLVGLVGALVLTHQWRRERGIRVQRANREGMPSASAGANRSSLTGNRS